jgi:ppGpp synthetase/RelA/SpoT-type nucleotidyltranferase
MPDLGKQYEDRCPLLEKVASKLEQEVFEALDGLEHIDRISFRVKGRDSFVAKAEDPENDPGYAEPLVEIEDQVAGRVLVHFLGDLPKVHERIARIFNSVEKTERRPERDSEFGYESDHLICIIPPQAKPKGWDKRNDVPNTFELQIRTLFMHAYAEPQHDMQYKSADDLPREVRRELAWIAASAWGADQAYQRVDRLLSACKDE